MPRSIALLRNRSTHCAKLVSARASDRHDNAAAPPAKPASMFRRVRLDSDVVAVTISIDRHFVLPLCHQFVAPVGAVILLLMRRLNLIVGAQFCDQAIEAAGETLDVEVKRIVVTV